MPGLFHKKSKSSLSSRIKAHVEDKGLPVHARKLSMGSTSSQLSTDSTMSTTSSWSTPRTPVCGPLSSHPPLNMNTSPCLDETCYYEEDEDRENHMFHQLQQAGENMFDTPKSSSTYSPVKENCYFQPENFRRKTYVYDQGIQWPLKDWQSVPPGLAELDDAPATPLRPRPANHQRRQNNYTRNHSSLSRDGAWKRQGKIFFDSDSDDDTSLAFF